MAPPDRARSQQDPNHVEVPNLMWLLAEDRAWDSLVGMVGMWPIYEWDEWDVYPVYPSEIAGVSSCAMGCRSVHATQNGHTAKEPPQLWRRWNSDDPSRSDP